MVGGMTIAIISSDKVVFGLAVGIPVLIAALVVLWSRPRRMPALWALVSVLAIAGVVIAAVAAFRASPAQVAAAPAASSAPPAPGTGGGPPPATGGGPPAASCSPSGTQLQITAQNITFDKSCLAAPADTAFTIAFDNKDAGTPHNIHIFAADPTKDPAAKSLFSGDLVTGPDTATYQVDALPAGTYFFHCDVHPTQMTGTFVSG